MRKYLLLGITFSFTACQHQNNDKQIMGKVNISNALEYVTAKNTNERLTLRDTITFKSATQTDENFATIIIDPSKTYQSIEGIGGAITDAAAETFYKLPKDKQDEIITAYYDSIKGIGYTLARTNIHSCDFSSSSYTYTKDNDSSLKSFSIEHDLKYRIPLIKEAFKATNNKLKLYISPWSPPAWMKTNNNMLHGGKLKPNCDQIWANYFVKFIQEYEKNGIAIWGTTVQNEPLATQTWESCIYSADEEKDFVKNFLGPTLWKNNLNNVKIMIWDHNRGPMYQRAKAAYDDPEASKYIWGMAFHWYAGNNFENVRIVHDAFPDKNLIHTEACEYPFDWKDLDNWIHGENYGRSMINDFNHWACGWTDWNIILDEKGGPNHVGNYCLSPIIGDTRDGSVHYMNSYYYIGHFSKFIRPGAKRIACSSTTDDLIATAFVNISGKIAVVIMNSTDKDLEYQVVLDGKAGKSKISAHSIITVII